MSAIVRLPNGKQAYLVQIDGDSIEIGDVHLDSSPENPVFTQLTGSIVEYGWNHAQPEPIPKESFAIGVRIEADNTMTTMHWNGSQWDEVV